MTVYEGAPQALLRGGCDAEVVLHSLPEHQENRRRQILSAMTNVDAHGLAGQAETHAIESPTQKDAMRDLEMQLGASERHHAAGAWFTQRRVRMWTTRALVVALGLTILLRLVRRFSG